MEEEAVANNVDEESNSNENQVVINLSDAENHEISEQEDEVEDSEEENGTAKKRKLDLPLKSENGNIEESDNDDSEAGQTCPICLDRWNNSGEHRLCSLRCGHLFGYSCIIKWLQIGCTAGKRKCPQCNCKAAIKDIRVLYARKLAVIDTTEIDKLKTELAETNREKIRLENQISKYRLQQKLYEQQLASMSAKVNDLERQQADMSMRLSKTVARNFLHKFYLEKTLEISKEVGCRVLDYNPWHSCIAVSQKTSSGLFEGYGVRKVDTESLKTGQFILLHRRVIRDIAFNSSQQKLLLSVSFDKTVKIMDIHNNIIVHGYPTDLQLWSGCWSSQNPNVMLVGAQNGSIIEFDMRQTTGASAIHNTPSDCSPVISLAAVPSNSSSGIIQGGFIAAHLNTCYAYEPKNVTLWTAKQMHLEGPFISVRYNERNNHALVSSRPNSRISHSRHTVFTIEQGNEEAVICNTIHTFNGGKSQRIMSRPCHINVENDTLIAAHQESLKSIPLWSVSSGEEIHSIPISDPITDMCSFQASNNIFLATLSSTKLRLYKHITV